MLRQATDADLNQVEEGYQKHFLHEKEHGAFTVFKRACIRQERMRRKRCQRGHCMSMKRMGTYWGVSLSIGTSRMNMKR